MNHAGPFFSCDWGTSSFRLRLVSPSDHAVLAEVRHGEGAKSIHTRLVERGVAGDASARSAAFAEVLSAAIVQARGLAGGAGAGAPVVVSGMASSTVGWRELPYARTPCPLDGSALRVETLEPLTAGDSRHEVRMISGLSTGRDMMRGEESELLGVLALPEFVVLRRQALVVLPGTHSKHVRIVDGAITEFRTFMTGELLELLSTRSLLGASVDWPPPAFDAAEFAAGVDLARSAGLAGGLFQVRVRSVLDRAPRAGNSWFLAGLVIGAEIADLISREPEVSVPILLAASPNFATTYPAAIRRLGGAARLVVATPEQLLHATLRTHALVLGGPAFAVESPRGS